VTICINSAHIDKGLFSTAAHSETKYSKVPPFAGLQLYKASTNFNEDIPP